MRVISFLAAPFFFTAASVWAQLPTTQLRAVFPAGAGRQEPCRVTISGSNLDDVQRLVFSNDGIQATQVFADQTPFDEKPLPVDNTFDVTVGSNVPPGRYEVRAVGKYGLSNPCSFVVGRVREYVEEEPNGGSEAPPWTTVQDDKGEETLENLANEIVLPATINGQAGSGSDVDWFRFVGKQGQRVTISGMAKRLDSQIDLSFSLFDPSQKMIANSRVVAQNESIIDAILPREGVYFIRVSDALYRNGNDYVYRLEVGSQPHLDLIFPPAGLAGSNSEYTVYGTNLPGGSQSDIKIDGKLVESLKVRVPIPADAVGKLDFKSLLEPHQAGIDGVEYRLTSGEFQSNALLVSVASDQVVLEESNDTPDQPQHLTLPCEVAGQFYPQRDVDWYSFEAKEGEKWMIDVLSQRLGVSGDASLLIQKLTLDQDNQPVVTDIQYVDDLQEQNFNNQSGRHEFDCRTTDPSFLFEVPSDGTYRILVKDSHGSVKSDPRLVYRLLIHQPRHDFRVVAVPANSNGSLLLRRGGRNAVRVHVFRQDGFHGEVTVACSGLPGGVTSEEVIIGPENTLGTLILTTASNASPAISTLSLTAKAVINGKEVQRKVRFGTATEDFQFNQPNANLPSVRSRLIDRIQLCVSDVDPAPMLLTIGNGQVFETSRGGKIKIPYVVKRVENAGGNINGFAMDFPPRTSVGQVNIGANEKGDFEMTFQATAPPGVYSIYLAGFNQGYQYSRNPELYEWAKARQERVAKILTEAQKKTQEAQQSVNEKQNQLTQATNLLNQNTQKNQQAQQAKQNAETLVSQSEQKVKSDQEAASKNTEDANLKTKLEQSREALKKAVAQLEVANKRVEDNAKQLEKAESDKKNAEEAKLQADQAFRDAQQFQQLAQTEKQRADQFANQKRNESNPRNININVPSNSIRIKVTEYPIEIQKMEKSVTVKQGEKIKVNLGIKRLYDFASNVSVQPQLPGGVGGISLQSMNLPADQNEIQFEVNAATNATVGQHQVNVRLQMNFNGQNLIDEHPLMLTILEVPNDQ